MTHTAFLALTTQFLRKTCQGLTKITLRCMHMLNHGVANTSMTPQHFPSVQKKARHMRPSIHTMPKLAQPPAEAGRVSLHQSPVRFWAKHLKNSANRPPNRDHVSERKTGSQQTYQLLISLGVELPYDAQRVLVQMLGWLSSSHYRIKSLF